MSDGLTEAQLRQRAAMRAQLELDLRSLMDLPAFRRVAHWLIYDVGRLNDLDGDIPVMAVKSGDAANYHLWNHRGVRSVGAYLHNELARVAFEGLGLMQQEHHQAMREVRALGIDPGPSGDDG